MSLKTLLKALLSLKMVVIAFVGLCCFPNTHHSKTIRVFAGYHIMHDEATLLYVTENRVVGQ